MTLLHIDSSILGDKSTSRMLTADVVALQTSLHPIIEVVYRDLAVNPALHLSGAHMAAWQGAAVEDANLAADLATGSDYLNELFAAEIIVIGAPMYNFTVPSQLKAWIDRIVVAGKTFSYTAEGQLQSLLPPGKKVIIVSTRGNIYGPGTPTEALEHQESYLRGVFTFLGIEDVKVVRAEGIAFGDEARQTALGKAREQIAALVA